MDLLRTVPSGIGDTAFGEFDSCLASAVEGILGLSLTEAQWSRASRGVGAGDRLVQL